jgi:hypothetical protein
MAVRKILGAIAVVLTLAASLVGLDVHAASAAAAKLQQGPIVTTTTTSLALTVTANTTEGNLLVATLAYTGTSPSFTGPAGWTRGPNVVVTGGGTEIWYSAAIAGGAKTYTFTSAATATLTGGELTEWSGLATVSPLDQSGTSTAASASSLAVSTSGSVAASGEVGITSFVELFGTSQNPTFTAGAGWTNLAKTASLATVASTTDYRLNPTNGAAASETQTSTKSGAWAAALATFKLPCTGGSLSVGSPSTLTMPAVSLNGSNKQSTSSVALTPGDNTGAAAGWNVQLTSTTFTNAASKTLPTSSSTITSGSASSATGTCALPTSSISYPVAVPAAASAPAAVKIYNAASATGTGPANITLGVQLAVPGNAYSGSYSSTWTFTIASGP